MAAEQQRPPVAPYIVYHTFRPQIAVYSSRDVDELAAANGLRNLAHLLKPWEASVERVTLRTSTFASHVVPTFPLLIDDARDLVHTELDALFLDSLSESITKRVPEWLAPMDPIDVHDDSDQDLWQEGTISELTPWYAYYRDTLVNLRPRTEYETFGHPVACILAVSTSNPEPLNAFAELYDATSPEKLFADRPWVDPNVLRYYVLVHDSTLGPAEDFAPLLEDIRRAYGLHTNLLVLNSEAVPKPDSAYIDASQRPLPKPADFSKHWVDLPTSPTLPHHEAQHFGTETSLSQSRDGANEPSVEAGAKLGEEDVRRIKLFLREFVVQNLAPWLERTTTQLNEQLSANRKGIAGRLFSAGRRYFGSRPASPATGTTSGTSAFDPIKGFYRHTTQEAQTRKLADFALMIADYRLAAANYELARKDFLNDKAWRYYSSATRMAGLLNLLLRKAPSGLSAATESDQYLEQAANAPIAGSAQIDGLRTIALYYELYQQQEDWRAAALALAKFASDTDELPSALMIEQAAMAMLRLPHPARRRFALLMTIAAHRYQKTGPKSLADRCGRQALSLFAGLDNKDWIDFRNHLERMLGRQAFNDGKAEVALMHFLRVLVEASDADNAAESRDFLDDIELAWARLGDSADDVSKSAGFTLPSKIFDVKRTAVHVEILNPAVIRSDTDAWSSLEKTFLEVGFPYTPAGSSAPTKRPLSLMDDATSNVVIVGENFVVELWATNELGVPVIISDINLAFEAHEAECSADDLATEKTHEQTIFPNTSTKVSVNVTASREGSFALKAVQFRYNGSIRCTEDLTRQGARLFATKAQMLEPTYAEDSTLKILVKSPQPILQVIPSEPINDIYSGETIQLQMSVENAGSRSLEDLRVLCDNPQIAFEVEDSESCSTGLCVIDNGMRSPKVSSIPLPQQALSPGQRAQWRVTLRGDAPGRTKLRWLFVFRSGQGIATVGADRLYTAFHAQEITVLPSLTFRPTVAMRNLDDFVLSVDSMNDNILEAVDIVGVATVSHAWQVKADQTITFQSLVNDQANHFEILIERVPTSDDPHTLLAPTISQLESLLQGRDLANKLSLTMKMIFSPTQIEDITCVPEQLYSIRTASRQASLRQQFPFLDPEILAKVFPMYLPATLDLIVFWRLPHSKRQGWHYIPDLPSSPGVNVVRDLLQKASLTIGSGRYEESAQERTKLIECLQSSELARSSCPVLVRQTAVKLEPRSVSTTRTSHCHFRVVNIGFQAVSCNLELLSNSAAASFPPYNPVRWVGRLSFRAKVGAGDGIDWVGKYINPTTVANQGTWLLSVSNGADTWQIIGPESLVGM